MGLEWCNLTVDQWASASVNDWAAMSICGGSSSSLSSSSLSSGSSSSSGPISPLFGRPCVWASGDSNPNYFKDFPFVETCAGGETSRNSVCLASGAFVWRADFVTIRSIGGFCWHFGLNYNSRGGREADGLFGPNILSPQDVLLTEKTEYIDEQWVVTGFVHQTGEFTSEEYRNTSNATRFSPAVSSSFLKILDGTGNTVALYNSEGAKTTFTRIVGGSFRCSSIEDRYGSKQMYSWETVGSSGRSRLTSVTDPFGRVIKYYYDNSVCGGEQVTKISYFDGEGEFVSEITFQYDSARRLEAVVGPAINHAVSDNEYHYGTGYVFSYDAFGRMLAIYYPNQVQAANAIGGDRHVNAPAVRSTQAARYTVEYYASPPALEGRVLTEYVGNRYDSGGTWRYSYGLGLSETDPVFHSRIVASTTVIDGNGNKSKSYFNESSLTVVREVHANRQKCDLETGPYITYTKYNALGSVLATRLPRQNVIEYEYYDAAVAGVTSLYVQRRGRVKKITRRPSLGASACQSACFIYEPLFQQLSASIEPRGLPIDRDGNGQDVYYSPQNGSDASRSQALRFATINYFDYQEDTTSGITGDSFVQERLGLSDSEIAVLIARASLDYFDAGLAAAGFFVNLQNLNGDGKTNVHRGSLIKVDHPGVKLISSSLVIQQRSEILTYNNRGQVTTHTGPEGNVTVILRHPFKTPDGVHTTPGITSDQQYGWVREIRLDVNPASVLALVGSTGDLDGFQLMISRDAAVQPNVASYLDLISQTPAYDRLGNALVQINPRRFTTTTSRTELGEPYEVSFPYGFARRLEYDANRNLIREHTQDKVVALNGSKQFVPILGTADDTALLPMMQGPGGLELGWFKNEYTYDLIDNRRSAAMDAYPQSSGALLTTFEYDRNQNLIKVTKPVSNVVQYDYDERDLLIAQRIGKDDSWSTTVFVHDENGNRIKQVDPCIRGFTGCTGTVKINHAFALPTGEESPTSQTEYAGDLAAVVLYDGFDNPSDIRDALGQWTSLSYDPGNRTIEKRRDGTPGGASPMDCEGGANRHLTHEIYRFDEAGRQYETESRVFLPNGMTLDSGRSVVQVYGGLTSNAVTLRQGSATLVTGGVSNGEITMSYVLSRMVYDRAGREFQQASDNFTQHTMQYDGANRRICEIDPVGNRASYEYDANGNVTRIVHQDAPPDDDARAEYFEMRAWHDPLDRAIVTAERGAAAVPIPAVMPATLAAYLSADAIYSIAGFDSRGNHTISLDGKLNTAISYFDGSNRLYQVSEVQRKDGRGDGALQGIAVTKRVLDGNGRLTSIQDANGNETTYNYDNLDRVTSITFPKNALGQNKTRLFEYNLASDITKYTDENGSVFLYESMFDGFSGLDALGRVIEVRITGSGGVVGTTGQTFQYDGLNRVTQSTDFDGTTTVTTRTYFDSLSRMVEDAQQIDSGSYRCVTQSEFRSYSAASTTYPQNGATARLVDSHFDSIYRRFAVTDQKTISDWRFYGPSRVADCQFGNGILGSYLNNSGTSSAVQTDVSLPGWGDGCSDRLGYDGAGRLIGKRFTLECPGSSSSSRSSRSSMSSASSKTSAQSLQSAQSGGSGGGTPNSILYAPCAPAPSGTSSGGGGGGGGGSSSSGGFGSSGSAGQSSLTSSLSSGSSSCIPCFSPPLNCVLFAGFTAAYDKSSNKLFERHLHAECRSFLYPKDRYDSMDRLLEYKRGLLKGSGDAVDQALYLANVYTTAKYNLDHLGNWVDADGVAAVRFTELCQDKTQSRTRNLLNQVATYQDSGEDPVTVAHDGCGNLIDDGLRTLKYDALNRVKEIYRKADNTLIASYLYDGQGRRVRKAVSNGGLTLDIPNGTTDFIYDGDQCVEERSGSTVLRQYVWGQYIDELIQQREYQNKPPGRDFIDYYPLTDLLHRTVALTDDTLCEHGSSGTSATGGSSASPLPRYVEVYDIDVYGRTRIYKEPGYDQRRFTEDDVETNHPRCAYLFAGYRYDSESGLHFVRARYYHPDFGRFISRDPIDYQGGMNLYEYCGGNPASRNDPHGLAWSWAFAGIGAVGGAIVGAVGYAVFGWLSPNGYSWGGLWGAIAGGAFAGAVVGGIVGAGTGDPSFLAAIGIGLLGGAAYSAAESPVRQMIDTGSISGSEWTSDVITGGALGALTGGLGAGLRGPARSLARRLGGTAIVRNAPSYIETWLQGGSSNGLRRQIYRFLMRAESATLSESGRFGRLARWHNRMQSRYLWGPPPGGTYADSLGYALRDQWRLLRTPTQIHHWLLPRNQWGRFVPNYIKNARWNLSVMASRAEHTAVDMAITNDAAVRYGLGFRQWFGSPLWLRSTSQAVFPQTPVQSAFDD